jgi:hypothetical protein
MIGEPSQKLFQGSELWDERRAWLSINQSREKMQTKAKDRMDLLKRLCPCGKNF